MQWNEMKWNRRDEELPSCRGVNSLYVRRKAPILRPTFLQIESTWGDPERLSSMIIPRRWVCETSLNSSFCSKSRTPVGRPWHARECGAMTKATVLETLIERPRSARAREISLSYTVSVTVCSTMLQCVVRCVTPVIKVEALYLKPCSCISLQP